MQISDIVRNNENLRYFIDMNAATHLQLTVTFQRLWRDIPLYSQIVMTLISQARSEILFNMNFMTNVFLINLILSKGIVQTN